MNDCKGILVAHTAEGKLYSGCTAAQTGAKDCPVCHPICDCEGIILKAGGHRVDCPLNEAEMQEDGDDA